MLLPINVKLLHNGIETSDVIFIGDRVTFDIVEIETCSKGKPKSEPITNDRFDPTKL